MEAKDKGHTIKVRHAKVVICGSSAAGKTNFMNLLLKENFEPNHIMTGVTTSKHKTVKKIVLEKNCDEISFNNFDRKDQIQWLRSSIVHHTYGSSKHKIPLPFNGKSKGGYKNKSTAETRSNENEDDNSMEQQHQSAIAKDTEDSVDRKVSDNTIIEKKIATKPREVKKQSEIWDFVTFLDTGGQPEYINMLPAVNSAVMITFVIISLENGTESLSQLITVHEEDGKEYKLTYNYQSLVKMLISMRKPPVVSADKSDKSKIDDQKKSFLSFVGTKSDLVNDSIDSIIDKVNYEVKHIVEQAECKGDVLILEKKYIIPVNNRTANTKDEDPNANLIRQAIYERLSRRKPDDIPIAWLLLELEIKQWCEDKERSYMHFNEVCSLCDECNIPYDDNNIEKFLEYYHHLGIFLYYNVLGLEKVVITNHQWLFDNLSKIVVYSMKMKEDQHGIKDNSSKMSLEKGLVDINEFENIKFNLQGLGSDYFVGLLIFLKVIAPVITDLGSKAYFMPCILPSYPIKDNEKLEFLDDMCGSTYEAEPLLMQISENHDYFSPNSYYGFPRGTFSCLIVQLLQSPNLENLGSFHMLSTSKEEEYIYNNIMRFQCLPTVNKKYDIILIDRSFYLEIQIRCKVKPETNKIYHDVRDLMLTSLENICKKFYSPKSEVCVAFFCCECNNHHLTRRKTQQHENRFYCQKKKGTWITSVWFCEVSTCTHVHIMHTCM